ncbi:phospho-N-acetylmuramoyl-pentapeptide-transferase [Candidatus Dependentiae bacterium]
MLYHLSQILHSQYIVFNIFRYVSVRAIFALLTSILFSFLFGNWFIKKSSKKFKSKVREWIPETHTIKNNTPTMGGLFILMVFSINTFLWCNLTKFSVWIFLLCLVGFGLIGFLDDWKKIKFDHGISAKTKFSMQLILAFIVSTFWYFLCNPNTHLCVPFFKNFNPDLGIFLIPWATFIIVATSNAVNLTDGLDGLAAGPLIFNFSTFSVIAYLAGHKYFAYYLYIPFVASSELVIFGATFIGALLGFLWYNTYPAQIFMGDVGSLALGAALGLMALMTRQELLLIIAGGIFVLETFSVIIQVFSFKIFGERVFKMAPIHHHYELLGWNEAKITIRFWIISIILSLITLLTLKIR